MSRNDFISSVGNAGADQSFAKVVEATGNPALVVDIGAMLLTADYVRSGPDLILVGTDGKRVLIVDYFGQENPPDLYTMGGAQVLSETVALLAGPAADGLAQASGSLGQPIGIVEFGRWQRHRQPRGRQHGTAQSGRPGLSGRCHRDRRRRRGRSPLQ
ncbi:MAG: hypothetical protein ACMVY4_14350 [Minwuia sp.]|uniref:hypothetical protein n=1 Tax=Minwuia sp. TaxID=2493630 RepID=UPI003A8AB7AE